MARINGKIILFVHIPKCGGSSIEKYLQEKGALGFKLQGRKDWCKTVPQHIHADLYKPMFPKPFTDDIFTVFRDPVQRILSEYRYRMDRREKNMPLSDWVSKSFANYKDNKYTLDNHLRPQVEFLCKGVKIFRFEDGIVNVLNYIDAYTETQPIEKDIWEKRSSGNKPSIPNHTLNEIKEFYKADISAYSKLKVGDFTVW
ncbi:MAG: sulfotransferase family 2 domain-containing protein [Paracoccus sp. (in: a-proteobacteria)]